MEIQISVIIWTLINFCLFMLIVRFLLFGPILSLMDGRREKSEKAKETALQRAQTLALTRASDADERERKLNDARNRATVDVKSAQERSAGIINDLRKAHDSRKAETEKQLADESGKILEKLRADIPGLATAYAKILTGNGQTVCNGSGRITNAERQGHGD